MVGSARKHNFEQNQLTQTVSQERIMFIIKEVKPNGLLFSRKVKLNHVCKQNENAVYDGNNDRERFIVTLAGAKLTQISTQVLKLILTKFCAVEKANKHNNA